jgi:hypothetical protein
MKAPPELIEVLRAIVSHEPWNEEHLAEWANEFLYVYDDDDDREQIWEPMRRRQEEEVSALKPQVGLYDHDPSLPALPKPPDGQLHGIGFIYDEDRDDRVLVAIDQLKDRRGLIAVAEHEGVLTTYSQLPHGETGINVCGDEWVIEQFVPYQGRWVEVTPKFVNECVAQVLAYHNESWRTDPPTVKQVAYLNALGYEGAEPKNKGEARALIAEYRAKKGIK